MKHCKFADKMDIFHSIPKYTIVENWGPPQGGDPLFVSCHLCFPLFGCFLVIVLFSLLYMFWMLSCLVCFLAVAVLFCYVCAVFLNGFLLRSCVGCFFLQPRFVRCCCVLMFWCFCLLLLVLYCCSCPFDRFFSS